MMSVTMDKKYRTRDGRDVRILCVDRDSDKYPVVGLVENHGIYAFTSSGKLFIPEIGEVNNALDLIEVKEKKELWMNIYPTSTTAYPTKGEADKWASSKRIACIRVEYEEGEGL